MEKSDRLKEIFQSKAAAFILAAAIILIALLARLEVIEPLIILFVIYCSLSFAKKGAVYSTIFAISVLALQDLYNLHIDLSQYLIEVSVIIIAALYIYKSTSSVKTLNFELRERVKELTGLYRISEAAENLNTDLDQLLNEVVQGIPPSYQFPGDCEARIIYQGNEYQTPNFRQTEWYQQKPLEINNKEVGRVEVVYLNQHPIQHQGTVFLEEEFDLLNSITAKITNILKNLEQEKEINEQRRFLSITLNSIGDGLIVTDKEGRVKRLNSIAEDLTGWTIAEAKNRDIREIFNIVNSKTGIEVKNPVDKVLKHGKIVGLANHTKLIARDGSEYHIADSAAPIKTDEGNIYGTVMVFRDVSKNYKMREEIKQREKMFSTAISESPFPIMVHAEDGEVITVNSTWENISGYTEEEIPDIKSWINKAYQGENAEAEKNIKESFTRQKGKAGEFEITTKSGEKRIWEFSTAPLGIGEDGRKLVISTAVDITRRKKAEAELRKLNKIYRTLSMVNQLIVRENSISKLIEEAAKITSEYGKYQNIWIGKINSSNEKIKILTTIENNCSYIKSGESHDLKLENQFLNFKEELIEQEKDSLVINSCKNSNKLDTLPENHCGSRAFFLLRALGKPWGIFSFCTAEENHFDQMEIELLKELTGDISLGIEKIISEQRRQESERKLKISEKRYRQLFENSPVGIFKTTSDGRVQMINPHLAKILGFDSVEETIMHFNHLGQELYVNPERRQQFISQIKETGMVNNFVYQAYDKNNNILWLEMNARVSKEKKDGSFVIEGFCWDITKRRESEEKIKYLGFHDKLTGLYNRAFLEEEIKRVDTPRQQPISIIMGDLNNLKLINDTYGHQTGDQLIKSAAEMIDNSCRDEDIIARWGGDEFVVLLPQTNVKESEVIIKRINQQIEQEEGELAVSISLGTASKTDAEQDLMAVLSKAEDRMYKNKIASRKSARSSVLSAFLTSLKEKSSETEEHVQRMSKMAKRFGQKVGLSNSEQDRLYLLTQMHDIGKIAVSEEILNKPGKLNEEEWEIIKKHTETGFRITSNLEDFAHISHEILHHHERWDGTGYPESLAGEEIPLLSRMLTIIDSYDVMISGRPYKEAMTEKEAEAELKVCADSQFDPELVDKFIDSL
ncbi:PAS domain S-box-containing protein/diguanylate cyclase (GGDEF)-like protein [Halanaerobium saccharolyticum]|uniref:PAS domain S-box-containing protein/diguanylate cyclase (GGDEF)-like protein n=1 Tax=Halanaerobium saccharolyticum TaxID=43595 RepID=A0A4R6M2G8_9FIRM|nr:PAS domain S-box protein [Halanaerobium saccharolyticum]TDO95166.1 PAS domain S-box-containing protein/diguanylate cyclase (GGDEF)-like protein [Halanaerobium saccharolyticum]